MFNWLTECVRKWLIDWVFRYQKGSNLLPFFCAIIYTCSTAQTTIMSMHVIKVTESKSKKKFRSAAEARQARELEESWNKIQSKWATASKTLLKPKKETLVVDVSVPVRQTRHIPSKGNGIGVAFAAPQKTYTGTKLKGISQTHKSNLVPVFTDEHITDIARMRR